MKLKFKFLYLLFILISFFNASSPLFAQFKSSKKVEKLEVYELFSLTSEAASGYHVKGFELISLDSKSMEVTIKATLSGYGGSELIAEKKVELLPKENRVERLRFPATLLENGKLQYEFIISGKVVNTISSSYSRRKYSYYNKEIPVLIDKNIAKTDADRLFIKMEGRNRYEVSASYFEGSVDMLDTDWTSYGQFAALVFYVDSFLAMPNAVKNAFIDYARAGGILVLIGDYNKVDKPKDVRFIEFEKDRENPHYVSWGIAFGYIQFLKSDVFQLILPNVADRVGGSSRTASNRNTSRGYSPNIKSPDTDVDAESDYENGPLAARLAKNILNSLKIRDEEGVFSKKANERLRAYGILVNEHGLWGYTSFLSGMVILFALLLGPINFYFLHKKNKRILIFLTVPVIALCSSLSLGFYYYITEYYRLEIVRQSITFLSNDDNKAITFGGEAIMSGRAIADSFSFPSGSIIVAKDEHNDRGRYYEPSFGKRVIKLGNNQVLGEGWIKPRSPIAFCQTSITQDRARVEITAKADSCEFFNGLGADILEIIYVSEDGSSTYKGTNIESGSRAEASSIVHKAGTKKFNSTNRTAVSSRFLVNFEYPNKVLTSYELLSNDLKTNKKQESLDWFEKFLKPGEYVASLRTNPFIKHDIDKSANVKNLACLVIGRNKSGTEK